MLLKRGDVLARICLLGRIWFFVLFLLLAVSVHKRKGMLFVVLCMRVALLALNTSTKFKLPLLKKKPHSSINLLRGFLLLCLLILPGLLLVLLVSGAGPHLNNIFTSAALLLIYSCIFFSLIL